MTDTAIPIPDDAQARIDQQTEAFSRTMIAPGASIAADLERSAQRWRVHSLMPHLTMRGVLVHGYVPPQGGVMWPSPDDYARGGVIRPRDHGDSIPVMLSPGMVPERVVEYYGEDLALRMNGQGRS